MFKKLWVQNQVENNKLINSNLIAALVVKNPPANAGDIRDLVSIPG